MDQGNDVVISGIGGYFPGARNLEQLKKVLLSNEIQLGSRWKEGDKGVTNKIGTMDDIDLFDAAFFGIHRHQASFMDPMQRLVLERTFEALVDAGVNPQDIRGKKIGVYTASSIGENDNLFYESIVSGFGVTGHSRAMMANRISYWLNLKGPSCAYDSNWNGGIEVLTMGVDAVRQGHCEAAIIGSANLNLNAEISWLYNDMGLLSQDASTKAYDVDATGYARSDGVVVMFIQRACDAKRNYASVLHSHVMFNGAREGSFLDLDVQGMENFITDFYKKSGVDPADVEYLETYGCAVKETDEVELNAIERAYFKTNRKDPLLIGSVKTQLGHSEASASLTAVAKVLVALETNTIPAHLQFSKPNPNIPGLLNGNLELVTKNREWKGQLAAVHGIGLSSSYGHVLLRGNPKTKRIVEDNLPRLILASTRNESGIQNVIKTIQNLTTIDPEYVALTHELFSKTISGHLYRGYAILDKNEEPKSEFEHFPMNRRPIWFVYSGMGSQWAGMATDLMRLPVFAESIMKCHNVLVPKGIDLLKIVTENDPKLFDNILHSFVGIAAIQIALTDVLKALGIVPDGIIGHSVGELGCAYADECLTAEQMMTCAYSRGKASIEVELIQGTMAAIGLGYHQVKDQCPPTIEVACHNSSESCTLSGPTADMEVFVKSLQDKGIFARLVNVANIAYHSRYIKPAAPKLQSYLKNVIAEPKARSAKWISTSVPEDKWNTDLAKYCSPDYNVNNLLSAVLFEEGSKHIPKDAIAIEIAPHGLLQAILKRSLNPNCTNIPLTRRGTKNAVQFLLSAIGKMFLAGIDVNLSAIYPPIEFPVSRATEGLAPLVQWEHGEKWRTGVEDKISYLVSVKDTHITLNSEEYRYCAGHVLDDNVIFPLSAYLEIIVNILVASGTEVKDIVFEHLKFSNVLVVPKISPVPIYAMIQKGSGDFEVLSGETIILSGRVTIPEPTVKPMVAVSELNVDASSLNLTSEDIYNELSHRGHEYSSEFKSLQSMSLTEKGSVGKIRLGDNWKMFIEGMLQQVLFEKGEKYQNVLVPMHILKVVLSMDTLPTEPTVVETTYNYYTGIVSNKHCQIIGLQTKQIAQSEKPIRYYSLEFVPFVKTAYESIESVINNSVYFVLDNFEDGATNNIVITEIVSENPLSKNIKSVLSKNFDISANVTTTKANNVSVMSLNNAVLFISNQEVHDELAKAIRTSHAFALVRSSNDVATLRDIVQVAQFDVGGVAYSLLRKKSNVAPSIVQVTGDSLSVKDLDKNSNWVSNLKAQASKTPRVFLVSSLVPLEGFGNFVRFMKSTPQLANVRSVFLLDKKLELSPNAPIFQQMLEKDVSLCVLKDGTFGSYLPIPIEINGGVSNEQAPVNTSIAKKNLEFIGINANDETLLREKHEVGLGNVDYSGVNNKGDKVMGLAKVDADSYDLIPDPILFWNVPEGWSMEDACSIPHAYSTAFFCLIMKARLQHGETVLVHNGCSAIGIAAISIASSYGCTVFTTVATDEQKIYLKKMFNKIRDRNIFSNNNSSFEPLLLMATGGEGAHVILNCLPKNLLNASVRCTAEFGRFIQLGKYDIQENNSIGMSVFLKNTSFGSVIPEELFERSDEDKEKLRDLVQDGIEKFVVRPIARISTKDRDIKTLLDDLTKHENIGKVVIKVTPNLSINHLNVTNPNQFICDAKSSYLIYGGTSEIWTDMVEWLVLRGARKIVVASDFKPQQKHITRRLTLLRNYFKADVVYVSKKVQTKDGAGELLSQVCALGPISGAFLLPASGVDVKSLQHIDKALRTMVPKVTLVNFINDASGVAQLRSDAGFPTCNITSPKFQFSNELYGLDEVLTVRSKNVIIKSEQVTGELQESAQDLYKKLTLMLPTSSEDLLAQSLRAPETATFVQVLTMGPRAIREVPPVFVIPGLFNNSDIVEMCRTLLHPTFVARLPASKTPLKEMARTLAEEIVTIFPKGPYNVVGVSWGGALAVEIGKILQDRKNTQLTFVDGAPDTIQSAIAHLGTNVDIEVNVLSRLLKITTTEVLKTLNTLPDWMSRLQTALDNYQGDKEDVASLRTALDVVMYRINAARQYQQSEALIKGEVYLIRPAGTSKYNDCGLSKYAVQPAQIYVVSGDHLSMLHHRELTTTINEYVAVR